MATNCKYETHFREASRLVAEALGGREFDVVYQSRSGPPTQPWLEPDVNDRLRALAAAGVRDVVVVPIGFNSDHIEVLYDLDDEAQKTAADVGLNLVRAGTVGTHPRFVRMIRELIEERTTPGAPRPALGDLGPSHDVCPLDCCLPPPRPKSS
jgi:ferrochelatase